MKFTIQKTFAEKTQVECNIYENEVFKILQRNTSNYF